MQEGEGRARRIRIAAAHAALFLRVAVDASTYLPALQCRTICTAPRAPRPRVLARMLPSTIRLPVKILPQPDEITCGPTCLHAIYRYWGEDEKLAAVIARARRLEAGGTFAVFLACDA